MKSNMETHIALLAEGLKRTEPGTPERRALVKRHIMLANRYGHSYGEIRIAASNRVIGKVAA